jgi:hypothetical protein
MWTQARCSERRLALSRDGREREHAVRDCVDPSGVEVLVLLVAAEDDQVPRPHLPLAALNVLRRTEGALFLRGARNKVIRNVDLSPLL